MSAFVLRSLRVGVVLGLGVALASACGSREAPPEESSSSSAALAGDDAGDADGAADSADGADDASDGTSCRNVVLVASKTYNPSAWADASQTLTPAMRFALPSEVPVTSGNAGNHWITFTFSLNGTAFTCRYNGGASQAHPNSPSQIALGLKYKLGTCTNGAVAGDVLQADLVKLHVDNGDSYKNPTTVRMTLDEATPCAMACNPSTCNDQNACNGVESCDSNGVCQSGVAPLVDDGNVCTLDACNASTGVSHVPVSGGSTCGDNSNLCVGASSCDGAGGCVQGPPPVVDDGNPCTVDACSPQTGVSHTPAVAGTMCGVVSDACAGVYACDGAGSCLQGPSPVIDDGNECTLDACNAQTGISHVPAAQGMACGDNSNLCVGAFACDGASACVQGATPLVDDGNVCTLDTCVAQTGVAHTPAAVGTACGDNSNLCAGAFTCNVSAQCNQGPAPAVDDGNICTLDACHAQTGPSHTPIPKCDPSGTQGSEPFERRASLLGRVVDVNGQPVTGATFQVLDLPASLARGDVVATTAVDGTFRLRLTQFADHEIAGVGASHVTLFVDTPGNVRAYRDAWVRPGDAPDLGSIMVIARDPKITVIGAAGGTATDSQGLVQVVIPPGALAQDIPVQITPFLTRDAVPAPLPDSTLTTYAYELEPSGTQFAIPVTIKAKNYRNVPSTLAMPVGVYDPRYGAWEHETSGTLVGNDWTYQASHFSTHDLNGNRALGDLIAWVVGGHNPTHSEVRCGGSTLGVSNGALRQSLGLPGMNVRGRSVGLSFNYDSGLAGSRKFNYGTTTTTNMASVPLSSFTAEVGGLHVETKCVPRGAAAAGGAVNGCSVGACVASTVTAPVNFRFSMPGSSADNAQTLDPGQGTVESGNFLTVPLDVQGNPVGPSFITRNLVMSVGSSSSCGGASTTSPPFGSDPGGIGIPVSLQPGALAQLGQKVLLHHRHNSPYGAGWGISEIDRLFVDGPDHVVLVDGDGHEEEFRPRAEISTGFTINSSSAKPVFARDGTTGETFAATAAGGLLVKVNPDLSVSNVFSGLAFPGAPTDLAVAYVNATRVFVVATVYGLVAVDGQGQITVLKSRTPLLLQTMFNQAHVATRGDLVYYTDGGTVDRLLYKVRLSDPTPTAVALSTPTNGDQRLDPTYPLSQVQFTDPNGMALTSDGSMFIADRSRNVVFRIAPDAQGEIGPTSLVFRAIGAASANVALPPGERFPGTVLPLSAPVYVSAAADDTLLIGTVYGLLQYAPTTRDATWLAYNKNAPDSDLNLDWNGGQFAPGTDFGNIVAVGPRSILFNRFSTVTRLDVPVKLASTFVPTRKLELDTNIHKYFLQDGQAETREAFDEAGRMTERGMMSGEPILSVQYVDQSSDRVLSVTDANGLPWTFAYSSGKLQTITDPANRSTAFSVDSFGDLKTLTEPDSEEHQFDYAGHKMISKTSPTGQVTTYDYSPNGNLQKATKPTGEVTTMQASMDQPPGLDANKKPLRTGSYTDPHGVTHTLVTNRVGLVDKDDWTADNVAYERLTVYDTFLYGNVPNTGDIQTRPNRIYRPAYHTLNGVQEDRFIRWDARGRVWRIGADANVTNDFEVFTYDAQDRIVYVDGDGAYDITHFERDQAGRLTRVFRADDLHGSSATAQETVWTYAPLEFSPTTVKTHGVTYSYTYAPNSGNVATVTDGLKLGSRAFTYDAYGNVNHVEDRNAASTVVSFSDAVFDVANRLTVAKDALGNETHYGYDWEGCGCSEGDKLTSVRTPDLPQNLAWKLKYDQVTGLLDELKDPDNNATELSYDPATGQLTQVIDANTHGAAMTHDQLGRITKITDSLGRNFGRAYPKPTAGAWTGPSVMTGGVATSADLTATLDDGQYQIGLDRFPNRGNPAPVSFYRDATFELSYGMSFDNAHRMISRRDRAGTGVTAGAAVPTGHGQFDDQVASYDGRTSSPLTILTGTLSVQRSTTTYNDELDASGSSGEAQALPSVTETYTRDGAGRLTAVSRQYSAVTGSGGGDVAGIPSNGLGPFTRNDTGFTYDANGRLSQWTDADGTHDVFYDMRGQIWKISASSDGDYLFEYDAVGRNTKLTYPGGLERTEAYDHEGRITSRCYSHPNATQRCYGATYDATGNPTSLSDPEGQDAITYDALDRLSTVTRGSETQTYDYNALGALKTNDTTVLDDQRPKLGGGGNASSAIPATYNNLPVTLDAGGRVTSLQGETLLYSRRGALAGITKVNGGTTDAEYYGHDAFGRRIATAKASTTGGVTTWAPQEMYEWTGANVTGQLDVVKLGNTSTPTVTVSKTWLFEGVDRPLRLKVGGLKYFYELDLAGNVRRLRRPDGSDAGGYRYSAFGTQYAGPAPAVDQPLRWKGRWWSDFGGIYDVRARQWSPALGAFTSIDEFGYHDARGTLWSWPGMNPIRWRDVFGRGYYVDNDNPFTSDFYMSHGDQVAGVLAFEVGAVVALGLNPFAEGTILAAGLEGGALGVMGGGINASMSRDPCYSVKSAAQDGAIGAASGMAMAGAMKGAGAALGPIAKAAAGKVGAAAARRLATMGDTQFRTQADALAEALARHGIDPSTIEVTPMYGKNPNLIGPKGEAWEIVEGLNSNGDVVKVQHHANGHFFSDTNEFELPHYHGPDGEHLTY